MTCAEDIVGEPEVAVVVPVENSVEGEGYDLYDCLTVWVHGENSVGEMATVRCDKDVEGVEQSDLVHHGRRLVNRDDLHG